MNDKFTLIYQDSKPIVLMEMKHYQCGMVRLSSPGQEVTVSERERRSLLKMLNGKRPIFIEKESGAK
jgi:hypothetical protein